MGQGITTQAAIQATTHYEWALLGLCSALSTVSAVFLAGRDSKYRDRNHLFFIGGVGGVTGLGCCSLIGHAYGGLAGHDLLLVFVAVGAGLGGRVVEQAITEKTTRILGVEPDDKD